MYVCVLMCLLILIQYISQNITTLVNLRISNVDTLLENTLLFFTGSFLISSTESVYKHQLKSIHSLPCFLLEYLLSNLQHYTVIISIRTTCVVGNKNSLFYCGLYPGVSIGLTSEHIFWLFFLPILVHSLYVKCVILGLFGM